MRFDILVLGTCPEIARELAETLSVHGLRSKAAEDTDAATGTDGWESAVGETHPRVVLIDVSVESSGAQTDTLAVLQRLRGAEASAHGVALPIVVRSEEPDEAMIDALLAAGASDVVNASTAEPLLVRHLRTQVLLVRQREEIDRKQRYQTAVSACARELIGGGELPQLLDHVLALLQQVTGASRAYIFQTEQDPKLGLLGSQIHECCAPGVEPQIDNSDLQRIPLLDATPNATRELSEGRPFSGLVAPMQEPERSLFSAQGILSILILPIFRSTEYWGFIGFDDCVDGVEWSYDDVALLKIVAEAIGLAVERARVEREVYRMAVQDPLTGLHNRRYMLDRLEQLASETARGGVRFTVALVDIDFFKRVNDTHGHSVGDAVLRYFATGLQQHFRPHDLVGRQGGEEFLVVMLNADEEQMVARLAALRGTMACEPFTADGCRLSVRFSAGVVSSTDFGEKSLVRELLDSADKNLYKAKREGRNRTVIGTAAPRR